jgi:hypothetical protein
MRSIDCPDGLARCTGGVVEVSRLASRPDPCAGSREACECPWDRLSPCRLGCVAEDVEVVVSRERAVAQLCAPEPGGGAAYVEAPPPFEDGGIDCADGRYICAGSWIVSCSSDTPPHRLARCINGCTSEALTLDDDTLTDRQATALLCRR